MQAYFTATRWRKKLGWQSKLQQVGLKLREKGSRITAKAPLAPAVLSARCQLPTEALPGAEILRHEFLCRDYCQLCGG
jgi:hypothetical protein